MSVKINISILTILLAYTLSGYGQVVLEPACAESVQRYGVTGSDGSQFWWYYDQDYGETLEGDGTDTVTIRWGYDTGPVELEVVEITPEGCEGLPSRAAFEIVAPNVDLGFDFPEICDEDTMVLSVGDDFVSPYEVLWFNGSNSEEYRATQTEQIWVRVIDGRGCIRYDTVSLLVNPLPSIDLGLTDTMLCDLTVPLELDGGNFSAYEWRVSSNSGTSSSSYFDVYPVSEEADTIFLTITDYNGCKGSDTVVVFACKIWSKLEKDMPNAITPNNDGENDVWNIPYMDLFPNAELEIFDRWGRLVYRTANVANEPWDGTSAGRPLPMDSYYYVLKLNKFNAEPVVGTVNLIR